MNATAAAPAAAGGPRHLPRARVAAALACVILTIGYFAPTERYLTPERGVGYALGVLGGSMMLLLLLYPARKRVRWLAFIGGVKRWFQAHMFLGVAGPVLVLFHANFSLGATNSNVALWSMVIVAASGLVGRYFYARIHHGLHGQRATLKELTAASERLRGQTQSIAFLPQLVARLNDLEASLLAAQGPWVLRPLRMQWRYTQALRTIRGYLRAALADAARESPALLAHAPRLRATALDYARRRLLAARRVAELESFERLFSWWHILHLPLFFMLVIAGVVHVVAVHVY